MKVRSRLTYKENLYISKIKNKYIHLYSEGEILKRYKDFFIVYSKNIKQFSYTETNDEITYYEKNFGEVFNKNTIKKLKTNNRTNKIIRRLRLISNIGQKTTSFLFYFISYGPEKAINFIKNNNFVVNNPGKNHGGKYSAYSKNFFKYKNLSEAEKESKIKEILNKKSKTVKNNPQNQTTKIEFYLNKGFSLEVAKLKLRERQATFSLEKCILKHGLEDGVKLFNERQKKWLNTLSNKSEEEKITINRKKGTGLLNKLFLHDPIVKQTRGILYYIHFYNSEISFYKIGITTKSIKERFRTECKKSGLKYDVILKYKDYFYNCYKKEQRILRYFNSVRENIDYKEFKSTECFNRNIIKDILRYAKIY